MLHDRVGPASRRRCCCWTSTGSRRSTTASGTMPVTRCCARSARACSPFCAPGDVLARLGGDEFAVLLARAGLDEAQERAQRLRAAGSSNRSRSRASGCTSASASASPPLRCPPRRRRSCCAAPTSRCTPRRPPGRACTCTSPTRTTARGDRLRTMEELRVALTDDQLEVHLQPQVRLADGARRRRRGPGPLAAPDPRPAVPRRAAAGRRAGRAAAPAHRSRPGARARGDRPVVGRPAGAGVGQPVGRQRHRPRPARRRWRGPWRGTACPPAALTLELVEDTLMADPERGRAVLGELRRPRRPDVDRRLRHRLQLAGLPAAPARRRAQARPRPDLRRRPATRAPRPSSSTLSRSPTTWAWASWPRAWRTRRPHNAWLTWDATSPRATSIARPMPVGDFLVWLERPARVLARHAAVP